MSKVLVAYATKSGSVNDIAERIAQTLAEAGATVDVTRVQDAPDAGEYDAVVVGSGIRVGAWHGPAKEWVAANAEALKARPTAFFTVGLRITEPDKLEEVRGYTKPVTEETGVVPVDVGMFSSWNQPKQFAFAERMIMKAMKAPVGDFRDLESVASWARETAPKLGVTA